MCIGLVAHAAPAVGGVVRPDGGLDRRVAEHAALMQGFQIGGRQQHDVDDVLLDDGLDLVEEFGARASPSRAAIGAALKAGGGDARAHVAILGVGNDEVGRLVLAGADPAQFLVEAGIDLGHVWRAPWADHLSSHLAGNDLSLFQ